MSKAVPKWRKTDESVILENCPDHIQIGLYYLRIYTAGAGYTYSEDNDLIHNLKKSPTSTLSVLGYKRWAISRFAEDLVKLFQSRTSSSPIFLVAAPGSKCKTDPEYDDRLSQVISKVCNTNLIAFPVLLRTKSIDAQHIVPGQRSIERAGEYLEIEESIADRYQPGATVAIVDDVLLSGATFSACRNLILKRFPSAKVIGLFWALSKNKNLTDLLDELK